MSTDNFRAYPIVCLEHEDSRLYAEVIQVVEARQRCWVRPLMLAVASTRQPSHTFLPESLSESDRSALYDLRRGADLVWPTTLFRPALDTEVLLLLAQLESQELSKPAISTSNLTPHHQLSRFVRQVWQACPEVF